MLNTVSVLFVKMKQPLPEHCAIALGQRWRQVWDQKPCRDVPQASCMFVQSTDDQTAIPSTKKEELSVPFEPYMFRRFKPRVHAILYTV